MGKEEADTIAISLARRLGSALDSLPRANHRTTIEVAPTASTSEKKSNHSMLAVDTVVRPLDRDACSRARHSNETAMKTVDTGCRRNERPSCHR